MYIVIAKAEPPAIKMQKARKRLGQMIKRLAELNRELLHYNKVPEHMVKDKKTKLIAAHEATKKAKKEEIAAQRAKIAAQQDKIARMSAPGHPAAAPA